MKFERESWRKLYVRESSEHRLMSLAARSFRDFLLRFADDDGALLRGGGPDIAKNLCRVIGADSSDRDQVAESVRELVAVGYLYLEDDALMIRRFVEGQAAQSPGARRQAEYKARGKTSPKASPGDVSTVTSGDASGDVSDRQQGDVTNEMTRNDETRRDKAPASAVTPKVPSRFDEAVVIPIAERADLALKRPDVAEWCEAHRWPEVTEAAQLMAGGMGLRPPKLAPGGRDSGMRAILSLFAANYTLDEFREAAELAKASEFMRNLRGIEKLSPTVMRRLLDGAPANTVEQSVLTP